MKQLILLLSMAWLISCNNTTTDVESNSTVKTDSVSAPQVVAPKDSMVPEDKIQLIRSRVQAINNMNLLVQNFKWEEDGCVNEGSVTYYLHNDSIVKVVENGFIGDGGWVKEYYYHNGKFIFSFMQHIGGPAAMPVDTSEIRLYADNDKLLLKKRNNDSFDDLSQQFNSKSVEYRILNAFKDKNFAKVFCN